MESEIAKTISHKKADLSAMSIKTYANCVSKVMSLISSTNLHDLFLKAPEVIKTLKSTYEKPNTIKTKIASVIVLLRCLEVPAKTKKQIDSALALYSKEIESLTGDVKKDLASGEKSAKMKSNWTTDEEVSTLKATLKGLVPDVIKSSKDLAHFRDYVLYMLYDDLPTRNDIADTKIVFSSPKKHAELSDEWNYIVLDKRLKKASYIMNQYKTAKSYGAKHIPLGAELYPILVKYKSAVDAFNGGQDWLFLNNAGTEKLSRNRLGVIYSGLGKSIGKKLSTTINRHIAVSRVIPLDKMKDLADKMGHSVTEAVDVYAKV